MLHKSLSFFLLWLLLLGSLDSALAEPDIHDLPERPGHAPTPVAPKGDINAPPPYQQWKFNFDMRVQPQLYDFFSPSPNFENNYGFLGVRSRGGIHYRSGDLDARLQLQNVLAIGLPTRALAPNPAGALGQGAAYLSLALRPTFDTLGIRQLWLHYGAPSGALGISTGSGVKIGRLNYLSGLEAPSTDYQLNWIK